MRRLIVKLYTGDEDELLITFSNMATALPSFPAFDVNEDQASSIRWKKWLLRFENFIVVLDIQDDTRKRAMLLHYAGDGVQVIFDTLLDTGEAKD